MFQIRIFLLGGIDNFQKFGADNTTASPNLCDGCQIQIIFKFFILSLNIFKSFSEKFFLLYGFDGNDGDGFSISELHNCVEK